MLVDTIFSAFPDYAPDLSLNPTGWWSAKFGAWRLVTGWSRFLSAGNTGWGMVGSWYVITVFVPQARERTLESQGNPYGGGGSESCSVVVLGDEGIGIWRCVG